MKKQNPAIPSRPSRTRPESSAPDYHPTTGQVLSEVEGNNPYLTNQPHQKAKTKKGTPTRHRRAGRALDA